MIPVSTLYDEYSDRPKLTEQKKPVEYIVPPPSRGVGTKNTSHSCCPMSGSSKDTKMDSRERDFKEIRNMQREAW